MVLENCPVPLFLGSWRIRSQHLGCQGATAGADWISTYCMMHYVGDIELDSMGTVSVTICIADKRFLLTTRCNALYMAL